MEKMNGIFLICLSLLTFYVPKVVEATCLNNATLPGNVIVNDTVYANTILPLTASGTLTIGNNNTLTLINGVSFGTLFDSTLVITSDLIADSGAQVNTLIVFEDATVTGIATMGGLQLPNGISFGQVLSYYDNGTFTINSTAGFSLPTTVTFVWTRLGQIVSLTAQAVTAQCTGSASIFFPFTETAIKPAQQTSGPFVLTTMFGATTGAAMVTLSPSYGLSLSYVNTQTSSLEPPLIGTCGWISAISISYTVNLAS